MRSGRTTEEAEATNGSSAGREGRGEMICGRKKRSNGEDTLLRRTQQ